ncbi:STAS domain-containing protein [Amycolatopsis sp., V23-08]|uniref:STAS domain-containing protein n=1 Tax=Amycolatopsis heterodermiae TaxID=3110235 RepID=A0ABU5R429_9PSEU|nr:STAS domain-containing protein [Amycolatopsis sp., V23-08]MEA5360983.1 STAS domain-containing protein [Amycolatopsis sp., V23-08]
MTTDAPPSRTIPLPAGLRLTTHRPERGTAVVAAVGDVDAHTAPRLRELLENRASSALDHLVIDLSEVDFMTSAGLAAVEHGYLRATGRGIACTVRVGPGSRLLRVARLFPLRFLDAVADHPHG